MQWGHLTTRHYMAMFDDASYQLFAEATGWNPSAREWEGKGWADVRHEIDYMSELTSGSLVEIMGVVAEFGNSSLTARYEMKNKVTGELAATMKANTVFFDLEKRSSIRITDNMRANL